jgi:hypothetical protein
MHLRTQEKIREEKKEVFTWTRFPLAAALAYICKPALENKLQVVNKDQAQNVSVRIWLDVLILHTSVYYKHNQDEKFLCPSIFLMILTC